MAVPREKITVAAAGKDGDHAAQHFGHQDKVAQFGRNGANGQSASSPTKGGDAKDISVQLSYSEKDAPGSVIVEGTKAWKGTRWEVPSTQIILLNARGGDGGKGGNGQEGQQGGQGSRGRDATRHRDAEDGGMGANGGDGGYGTNGANGGNAGNLFIRVNEDDLDLLLPVYWDVRGGKGGESGSHGLPGDGGIGGDGGDGGTWVERSGDTKRTITRGPGRAGPSGRPGAPPPKYLQGGVGGNPGSSQVTVLRNNGTEATYPTRYELKVVSFDVVDENQDGIFEPGEHLLVKNIRVQNTGGMPSPSNHNIQVLIHGSHWLDPIVSEPVTLPKGIPVDEVVEVPGVLRAFIMQERALRAPGQPLLATDDVQLIATMGRINRTIPEFTGSTKIEIKYPLQLDAPNFLDCVSPGDHITFSWTLRNISSKPYGIQGAIRRGCATTLIDAGHLFDFVEAEGDNKHEMIDPLDVLDPGSEVPISQTFKVSDMAYPYSVGHLKLDLLLSEPGDDEGRFSDVGYHEKTKMRSIMSYPLVMQISGVYSHNPHSSFLLVVNSATPNSAIHQIIRFVREELRLYLDIFNLSVGGTFTDPATKGSVLENYIGKSVIVFGNAFPYFGLGTKSAFDLLDPWNTCALAKAGTNFHFAGATGNIEALKSWASLTTFPIYAYNPNTAPSSGNVTAPTVKELLAQLHSNAAGPYCKTYSTHSFPSKKTLCGSPDSALASNAERAAKLLNKNFPLARFAVVGDTMSRTDAIPGTVVIREGFPRTASITASLMEYGAEDEDLAEYQKHMIISSLQFKARACMFWNMAGVLDATGVDSTVLLSGQGLKDYRTGVQVAVHEIKPISEKICKAIILSVEYDLGREIGRFTRNAPSFDPIPKQNSLSQLPLLNQFFDMEPPSEVVRSTERTQFIGHSLGVVLASLLPISGGESFRQIFMSFGNRKSRLRPQVVAKIDGLLARKFAPEVVTFLKAEATRNSKEIKKHIKAIQGGTDTTSVSLTTLSTLVNVQKATFFDLTDINPTSVAWTRPTADGKVGGYNTYSMNVNSNEAHSSRVLEEMTSKIEA